MLKRRNGNPMADVRKSTGEIVKSVADFRPLTRVVIPDVGDIRLSGLILIVGPNSSGKSHLLRDIYLRVTGDHRKLVVATEVSVAKPEYNAFVTALKAEGYIEERRDQAGNMQFIPRTTYAGSGRNTQQLPVVTGRAYFDAFDANNPPPENSNHQFLGYFGRFLITALFLDRRLTAIGQVGLIAFRNHPPQHDLHALHQNDRAKVELTKETFNSFGKSIWTDITGGDALHVRVADKQLPSAEERHSATKMASYRIIEEEGDGLKSWTAICVPVLLGNRPVCLIDEPEMCLHPPQAYNLGAFIARHAVSDKTATYVATHSSQILRGVIQATKKVEIIRLTRVNDKFHAHRLSADQLFDALKKPTLRAESVLDGIFSESVVILEADGDRLVYHTCWDMLGNEVRLDVHFAAVGGTGGIADTSQLYRSLRIPVAVIADRDVLADFEKLRKIISVMADPQSAKALIDKAKILAEEVRKIPPTIEPSELRDALLDLKGLPTNWQNGDDLKIRSQLNQLSNRLQRMRRLKHGPITDLPSSVADLLREMLQDLKRLGIFVVPVGELEDWFPAGKIEASREDKAAFANEAASLLQSELPGGDGIWLFLREIAEFLQKARSEFVLPRDSLSANTTAVSAS